MAGHPCDSHTKLSGKVPMRNWRKGVTVHTRRKSVWHSPRRRGKKCFTQSVKISVFIVNSNGTVPQIDKMFQTGKTKMGKEFIETYRGCQELQGIPVRRYYFWTNKKPLDLAHEVLKGFSPGASIQFSKTAT